MSAQNWSDILKQLIAKTSLTYEQAESLMHGWLEETIAPELSGAILTALQCKGIEPVELAGMAQVLQQQSLGQDFSENQHLPSNLLDTCGTGGDGADTFNISTAVAFVAATAGVPVAKHGNRAVSSRAGSADVLEALGINLNAPIPQIHAAIAEVGIAFLFAPYWHPAMKAVAPLRRSLGIRTVFNLIGPLVNPLFPNLQVMGVYHRDLVPIVGEALKLLGRKQAVVLHSREGMDEAGLGDVTDLAFLQNNTVTELEVRPEDVGLRLAPLTKLKGGSVIENAEILRLVLQGKGAIAQRDCVAFNSGIALTVAGVTDSWVEGVSKAGAIIDSGMAWHKLESLVKFLA